MVDTSAPNQTKTFAEKILIQKGRVPRTLLAYPDPSYFKPPNWQFEDTIPPGELHKFAAEWLKNRIQIVGGCCGPSLEHIAAIRPFKDRQMP